MNKVRNISIYMVILICMYISWLPLFSDGSWLTFDLIAHIDRAVSTVSEIHHGQVPTFFDFSNPKYPGYSWNLFYPPLENFIFSGLLYLSNDLNGSLKILSAIIIFLSFFHSYIAFDVVGLKKERSLLLSILFSFSIYQVNNIFIRGSIPESLAISFIPLLIVALVGNIEKKNSFFFMSYSISGLLLSNLPLFLCGILVSAICLIFNQCKILPFLKSLVFSILLTSFYFLPLLFSIHNQDFPIMDTNWFPNMSEKSIGLYDLISGEKITSGKLANMSLGIGWPIFFIFVYSMVNHIDKKIIYPIAIVVVLIICAANYSFLPHVFYALNKIQYMWRLIPFLIFLILVNVSSFDKIRSPHLLACIVIISLMSSWISEKSHNSYNITKENFRGSNNVVFSDYALKNALKLSSDNKYLLCQSHDKKNVTIPYSMHRGKYGLPFFSFNVDNDMTCRLPVMSYTALTINGIYNPKDGYFLYEAKKGPNIAHVKYSHNFMLIFLFGIALSLVSWVYLIYYRICLFKKS
ncbi:glycosyltransferase family protein [Mangrovibacter yixingensis]|uniref:6-pyruvoyl-tetrahydropterin synthase-related protein n=1 Tax=Mangrovibacter yixingensis TaxID=1529639 RepID=UPI001CF9FCBA|nr:6-pyruvoyl-tetrahydropterin synthase-related protein [Mangrovibacter yixingensis]